MSEVKGGFFEQIQGKINQVAVDHYYGPRVEKSLNTFPYLVQVMEAHLVMLDECGIIPREASTKLARALSRWREKMPKLDPHLEDLYINLESLLITELGSTISGYLPIARSRNDVEASMWRLQLREELLKLAFSTVELINILHNRAAETIEYLMPGYTYGQQAQPVTLGHYLTGIALPLLRSIDRIIDCINRFNQGPLGSGALAGTSYPINRVTTAILLGFNGVLEHTEDAVASADFLLEAANNAVILLNTIARFSEDIIKWCANEIGFADLPDDLIDSSSIMPQKRNPVICATIRAQARLVAGNYAGIINACSVGFEASRDVTVSWENVLESLKIAYDMNCITQEIVKGLKFNKEKMGQSLNIGFSNATEIADSLVLEGKIDFRSAHKIVGGAIAQLYYQNKGPEFFTYEILNSWSKKVIGRDLPISREKLELAMDYSVGVERRNSTGGTSKKEIKRMLTQQCRKIISLNKKLNNLQLQWEKADKELKNRIEKLYNLKIEN